MVVVVSNQVGLHLPNTV